MRIRVYLNARRAAAAVARDVAAALERKPTLVLGLPTGRTPQPIYDELAARAARGAVNFAKASSFNLDEFTGVPRTHPSSYRAFMERHLFSRVNISRRRTHVLNGAARRPEAECARYERAIERVGGIDVLLLGLGVNGHIGFNEPGRSLVARTHRAPLRTSTRRANASLFGGRLDRVPHEGMTMGVATILGARRIVLIATGRSKATAVRRMIEGPITPRLPASFLQLHPDVDVVLDRAAASDLKGGAGGRGRAREPRTTRRPSASATRATAVRCLRRARRAPNRRPGEAA